MGKMFEPPFVMRPHIAVAPFFTIDLSGDPFEIREVVPVIAIAEHETFIAPIIILLAIGSKMDIAAV